MYAREYHSLLVEHCRLKYDGSNEQSCDGGTDRAIVRVQEAVDPWPLVLGLHKRN